MKLLGLEDLPNDFRLGLNENFREKLFAKAVRKVGSYEKLGKFLDLTKSGVWVLSRGRTGPSRLFISVNKLKILSRITGISLKIIEKNVSELKTQRIRIKINLPIFARKEVSKLVAHFMGDGHLHGGSSSYFNEADSLIEDVKTCIRNLFNLELKKNSCKGGSEIYFPTLIANLCKLCGAPEGSKVNKSFYIPDWIINGSKEIKSAFLQALFDDEASVINNYPHRYIVFGMSKSPKFLDSHIRFLNQIRKLLSQFGIATTKPTKWAENKSGSVEHAFLISDYRSLSKFSKEINFLNRTKRQQLVKLLDSYTSFKNL